MFEGDITPEAVPVAPHVSESGAAGTVEGAPANAETLTLSEINGFLGKDFKDKPTALKSLKDTFSYVGKKKEDIEREVLANVQNNSETKQIAQELAALRKDQFYDRNPQYASHRALIDKLGGNPAEVVESPEFKDIYTKASGYDETQKLKTVLESNPRLASSRDALTKARDIVSKGQPTGRLKEEVEDLVVKGIRGAYDF